MCKSVITMIFRNKRQFLQHRFQSGFTMLEVVVAMAVGAVGVMAFIGLQLKSVEISEDSRKRANAAYIAEEMAERMMANAQDEAARRRYQGEDGSYWSYTPSSPGYFFTYNRCSGTSCEDAAMAAYYDMIEVKTLAAAMLPNGKVGHRKCGTGDTFDCIVVAWEDADTATCSPTGMDGSGVDDCYVLQLKIW